MYCSSAHLGQVEEAATTQQRGSVGLHADQLARRKSFAKADPWAGGNWPRPDPAMLREMVEQALGSISALATGTALTPEGCRAGW